MRTQSEIIVMVMTVKTEYLGVTRFPENIPRNVIKKVRFRQKANVFRATASLTLGSNYRNCKAGA